MANRSDRGSIFPRKLKRMISLMETDPHRAGVLRRLFIDAHRVEKEVEKKRLSMKYDGLDDQGTVLADNIFTTPITRDKADDGKVLS